MKRLLRSLAVTLWVLGLILWLAGGRKVWTQTQEQVKTLDAVTGIEGIEWQPRFRAGLDFFGGALTAGGIAWITSLFAGHKRAR